MFKNRLASHLERGVIGFPHDACRLRRADYGKPGDLTVTSGFGSGRYLCPCGTVYYDASAVTARKRRAYSHDWLPSAATVYLRDGAFSLSPVRFALT